jgi:hypothetical protein
MNEVMPFQPEQNRNLGRKTCIATWLRIFAGTKKLPSGFDLTEETAKLFEFTLRSFSLEQIQQAFERADREFDWFPQPVEVRNLVDISEARAKAYQKRFSEYETAYAQKKPELRSLPSVLDTDPTFGAPHGKRRRQYIEERKRFLFRKALAAAGGKEEVIRRLLADSSEQGEVDQAVFELLVGDNQAVPELSEGDPQRQFIEGEITKLGKHKAMTEASIPSLSEEDYQATKAHARLEARRQHEAELERRARIEDPDYDETKNREAWLDYRPPTDDENLVGFS